jgi:hypothetical protein
MRTTVNLDEDVLSLAKALAEARGVSIGKALSDLARKGATTQESLQEKNGFWLFPAGDGAKAFGPEDVEAALAEEDIAGASHFVTRVS